MLGVLMDAGEGAFGDHQFMADALEDIRAGNERGQILAQGTGRVGEHYQGSRVPVIKNQGISAYDPRVIEVTGISMMVTAQGADHTAGNIPGHRCDGKSTEELTEASLEIMSDCAAADSLGLCLFGRSVTNQEAEFMVGALNDAHGTNLEPTFFRELGHETLRIEWEFNKQAGFTEADDELPDFFYDEALEPSGKKARHHTTEVNKHLRGLMAAS
jgi:aldehyde:ferredoxin oxidoreductase